jgi:putative PIN family toxin of toxin-antitoxin system
MRYVLDTNILVSALLITDSLPAQALTKAENTGIVLYSLPVLAEIAEVLSRPKLAHYLDEDTIPQFLARISRSWQEVSIIHTIQACRDPKDDKFLELALNGEADVLVTGDKDLLELHSYQGLPILTAADFLQQI